jgi:hypothetical protein
MKTIWKYPIPMEDQFDLHVPEGGKLLAIQIQGVNPVMWFEVEQTHNPTERSFHIVGTGHHVPDDVIYCGTFQLGLFVWHIYEES